MKDEKKEEAPEEELEGAKDLLVEGLGKIVWAAGKISKEIIKGFKKGYAEDEGKEDK
jgi:hypothetical protein